mmetsp:Transcript_8530/g.13842  ORF Transcript_8530/g.13842 Transcript_8530/m.13842 type:complete len:87 (+) Transcript_8530:626-886(+)
MHRNWNTSSEKRKEYCVLEELEIYMGEKINNTTQGEYTQVLDSVCKTILFKFGDYLKVDGQERPTGKCCVGAVKPFLASIRHLNDC